MKRLMIVALTGCVAAAPAQDPTSPEAEMAEMVIGREAFEDPGPDFLPVGRILLAGRDPGCEPVVESRTPGSFTAPDRRQVLYVVHEAGCGPHSENWGKRFAVVTEAGRRVAARRAFGPAVASVDVDGDGLDEWIEAALVCNQGACVGELRVESTAGQVAVVPEAYESRCGPEAGRQVRWAEVRVGAGAIRVRRLTGACR